MPQIPADMITLDPSNIGSLAPESKLVTAVEMTVKGTDSTGGIPFARLPRSERLKVQGKYDETEVVDSADEDDGGDQEGQEERKAKRKEEKEKKKMRGKNKSLKRFVIPRLFLLLTDVLLQVSPQTEEKRCRSYSCKPFSPFPTYWYLIMFCRWHCGRSWRNNGRCSRLRKKLSKPRKVAPSPHGPPL
jgi:hypothetical protein